jgi:hypothetical protein
MVARYGYPQAFAWNIGTTGMIGSFTVTPSPSGLFAPTPNACRTLDRCE